MKLGIHGIVCVLILAGCDREKSEPAENAADRLPPPVARRPRIQTEPAEPRRSQLATALGIESPEEREAAIAEIAWNALESDPELAQEALGKLTPDSEPRIKLLRHFAMNLAGENPAEALEWANQLESDVEESAAMERIALVIAEDDPSRAAHLLSESGIEGRGFDVAVVGVLQRWASQNAADAAAWVALFPAGDAREAGIRTVISEWTETDPGAAVSWMGTLDLQELRDEAALAMALALSEQEPEAQSKWLEKADPITRAEIDAMKGKALEETGGDP